MAQPVFIDERLEADFGQHNTAERSFVSVLKAFLKQYNPAELQKRVTENDGAFQIKLDGVDVTLRRGTHFFLNKKDQKGML